MDQQSAFTRAWSFLNFKPVAKWTALTAAVATGVLYVALLVVLVLFTDLMVNQGHIPSYQELPASQRERFRETWLRLPVADRKLRLEKVVLAEEKTDKLAAVEEPDSLSPADQEELWRAYVAQLLTDRVGQPAANAYLEQTAPVPATDGRGRDKTSLGVLSFIVAARDRLIGRVIGWLASWNSWMWKFEAESPNTGYLVKLLCLAIGLGLARAILIFVTNFTAALATIEAATRMRRAIYHHTFRLGTLAIRALGPSEAVGMFTRHVEAVHDGLYAWLTVFLREPVKFGLLVAFALLVNFWLALAFLVFALLVWLIGSQIAAYFLRQGREATHRAANHLALLQESLMMMRLVKCYLMELFNQARVERQLVGYARSQLRRLSGEATYWPFLAFLALLASVALLAVAGWTILDGRLEVASAIAQITALVSLYWPLENFIEHRRFVKRGRESAAILFKFLDRPGEVGQAIGADNLPAMGKLLELADVSLREPGTNRMLLQGVNLAIAAGVRVALVGPDEMEKHALVYLIPRFLDPTDGEIRIDQHNIRWVTLDSLRSQIALVLQHNLLFNDTAANNIGCGDAAYTLPQIIEAAKVAHAHHFIQKLPKGYETPIGEMGHYLNIGEQFRVALARAILRDPAVLIIEEPGSALLDEDTKALLDDTFSRILPGRTVIFLPHRVSTIRSCNRVFLLHKGRIEAAGEHRELIAQNELYQHLHYLEFNMFAGEI